MTLRHTALLLPFVFSIGSHELCAPAGPNTGRALAMQAEADAVSARNRPGAEPWLDAGPLLAWTEEAPLEREACAAPDQRHRIQGRIDRTVVKVAGEQLNLPLGSGRFLPVNGQRYLFCLEQHYREPGSTTGPTGWHKGVTVYAVPDDGKIADLGGARQRSL